MKIDDNPYEPPHSRCIREGMYLPFSMTLFFCRISVGFFGLFVIARFLYGLLFLGLHFEMAQVGEKLILWFIWHVLLILVALLLFGAIIQRRRWSWYGLLVFLLMRSGYFIYELFFNDAVRSSIEYGARQFAVESENTLVLVYLAPLIGCLFHLCCAFFLLWNSHIKTLYFDRP